MQKFFHTSERMNMQKFQDLDLSGKTFEAFSILGVLTSRGSKFSASAEKPLCALIFHLCNIIHEYVSALVGVHIVKGIKLYLCC
jgi:hypothetical protein